MLAAKGLVLSRPRVGTVVCDRNNWSIIDPQVLAWHAPDTIDLSFSMRSWRRGAPSNRWSSNFRPRVRPCARLPISKRRGKAWRRLALMLSFSFVRTPPSTRFSMAPVTIRYALNFTQEATANSVDRRDEAVQAHFGVIEALRMRAGAGAREAANEILDMAARDLERAKIQNTASTEA
jgi:GntR family galactonate operon transcriptional repressor